MFEPLLTIIVPTYNRSANLAILLKTLREETASVANEVVVYVSDNSSSDDTPNIVTRAAAEWPNLRSYRHSTNIGPERNFCHAVDAIKTRWFWIIGDDDLPKRGVISRVVNILRIKYPVLLYMQSEWISTVENADQGVSVADLQIRSMNSLQFAEAVHVWFTFISSTIVDKERLLALLGNNNINRFDSSNLVQLGWVLPLLKSDGPFLYIIDSCILATKDNSGGYGLLTVFGINFTRIVNESFGSTHPLSRALIGGNITQFLPGLIWGSRNTKRITSHTTESPWRALNKQLGSYFLYWFLLVPLGRLPRLLAMVFFLASRILNKVQSEWRKRFC